MPGGLLGYSEQKSREGGVQEWLADGRRLAIL